MQLVLSLVALVAIAAPSQLLLLDLLGILKAPGSIKKLAPPALLLLGGVIVYSVLNGLALAGLIGVGLLAGIIGTVALDSIRIPGYLLGYMPLDLPLRFGTKALDLDQKFMLGMMGKVMRYINEQMGNGVPSTALMDARGFPTLSVRVIRRFARPTMGEVLQQNSVPLRRVRLAGYLWHYSNGASFGVAHVLLFGRGAWVYTIGFGLLLALVFLMIIRYLVPPMKLGVGLPLVVLLAHAALSVTLGLITQSLVTPSEQTYSFLHMLGY